jgi:hypothetical protein
VWIVRIGCMTLRSLHWASGRLRMSIQASSVRESDGIMLGKE